RRPEGLASGRFFGGASRPAPTAAPHTVHTRRLHTMAGRPARRSRTRADGTIPFPGLVRNTTPGTQSALLSGAATLRVPFCPLRARSRLRATYGPASRPASPPHHPDSLPHSGAQP